LASSLSDGTRIDFNASMFQRVRRKDRDAERLTSQRSQRGPSASARSRRG
jgi:hypothetical protein